MDRNFTFDCLTLKESYNTNCMKNLSSYICLALLISASTSRPDNDLPGEQTNSDKSIVVTYKGFYAPVASYNSNQLIFTVQNNTNDTLYLSSNNIKVEVRRKDRILKEDPLPKTGNLFPPDFLTDDIVLTSDISDVHFSKTYQEKKARTNFVDSLKKRFANQLFKKNAIGTKKINKDFFYSVINSCCFVLLPNEKIKISRLFINSTMDNSCVVKAEYTNSNTFTSFEDEDGNKIDVKG